jgi:dihydroorotase
MVERDLRELRKHPRARYHVLHVSSAKTVELVRAAKAEGLRVTAEVTPHHLYFNVETMDEANPAFKMNPPIRAAADQRALWAGLADGTIDFVATDHAPHEAGMKRGSYDDMAFGTLGLETTMNVLIWGYKQGMLTAGRLLEVWSTGPAEFLRLPRQFGKIELNAPFHAAWVDLDAPDHLYTEADISSLSKNSCFTGAKLPGRVRGAFHERRAFTFNN